jgi:hypothetical protein
MNYLKYTLAELLQAQNETVRRNAISIWKTLGKQQTVKETLQAKHDRHMQEAENRKYQDEIPM